jgi:FkbM family methyltransferase
MLKVLKVKSEILLRKIGSRFGLDLKMTDEERFMLLLKNYNIDLIFDVGANTGQYAETLYKLGYKHRIVSFEPLSDAHAILSKISAKYPAWDVAERCALGNEDGEIDINVSENSVSSSILNVLDEHVSAEPRSHSIKKERTKIFKLDTIAPKYIGNSKNILLKVDTQGFEDPILEGANETIKILAGIQLEMSLTKLYEGQKLFKELYEKVTSLGFDLNLIEPSFTDKNTGRLLQIDGVFYKSK